VYLKLPSNYSSSEEYPLIVNVYGGPGSQYVTYAHQSPSWDAYMVGQGYIYASIDGRGTGARGLNWLWSNYLRLGVNEAQDQIDGAAWLINNPVTTDDGIIVNINKSKTAIWGWSYGGYTTSMVMGSGSDVFKVGISVAPVTDWTFYDSVYTERYMMTPAQNSNYNSSSVLTRAPEFKSNTFLLIHGTGDDNVHFLNSAVLESALVDNNVQFQTMSYINQNHRINGGNSSPHLYTLISNFIFNNL